MNQEDKLYPAMKLIASGVFQIFRLKTRKPLLPEDESLFQFHPGDIIAHPTGKTLVILKGYFAAGRKPTYTVIDLAMPLKSPRAQGQAALVSAGYEKIDTVQDPE